MTGKHAIVPVEQVERTILLVRGQKVILDTDLAELYGVTTKRLNQQVRRNTKRFPSDFMFRLSAGEKAEVVANCNHLSKLKFSRSLPHAFTEHGAIMAASVLNTPRAI
ncbi:MAG: ORF6N domain-containing protein [Thermodesulfobacteriota bacterium]|nr:ORF6N domain-containing protein [Thermodesulfobacteriota bacterium]